VLNRCQNGIQSPFLLTFSIFVQLKQLTNFTKKVVFICFERKSYVIDYQQTQLLQMQICVF